MPAQKFPRAHPSFALELDLPQQHRSLAGSDEHAALVRAQHFAGRAVRAAVGDAGENLELPRTLRRRKGGMRGGPRVHRADTAFDGGLTMEEANITGNGFTGAITADAGFTDAVGSIDSGSSYSGTFFGPGAEEVGGGINLTGTGAEDGLPYLAYGHWRAWQD